MPVASDSNALNQLSGGAWSIATGGASGGRNGRWTNQDPAAPSGSVRGCNACPAL